MENDFLTELRNRATIIDNIQLVKRYNNKTLLYEWFFLFCKNNSFVVIFPLLSMSMENLIEGLNFCVNNNIKIKCSNMSNFRASE